MEIAREGVESRQPRKVSRATHGVSSTQQRTGKKSSGPRMRDDKGRQLTPAEIRRYKKRITNRESARRMRQLRKDEWGALTKEVAGLREENAALRSESRMVMEQASVLFQEAQALHAMHRNLATSSQRVGLGLRSLHNMLLEKERARPQVPVHGPISESFPDDGSDGSQDLDDLPDADVEDYKSPSPNTGKGSSPVPSQKHMSPPCADMAESGTTWPATNSPSPPATPPNGHAPLPVLACASTLPPAMDHTPGMYAGHEVHHPNYLSLPAPMPAPGAGRPPSANLHQRSAFANNICAYMTPCSHALPSDVSAGFNADDVVPEEFRNLDTMLNLDTMMFPHPDGHHMGDALAA